MTIAARTLGYSNSAVFNGFSSPVLLGGSNTATMRALAVSSLELYVSVGTLSSGYPAYSTSTDGVTWTAPAAMNGSTTACTMTSVAVNSAGLFVAVGYNSSNYPMYAYSSNGSTWTTPAAMGGSTTPCYINAITVDSSGLFVAVGYFVSTTYAASATSSNGTTWSVPAILGGLTFSTSQMTGVTASSTGRSVAVGTNGGFDGGLFSWSDTPSNNSSWIVPQQIGTNTSYGIRSNLNITVSPSGLFVATGNGDGSVLSSYQAFVTSSNGVVWSTPAQISSLTGTPLGIAVNRSGLFVSVGYSGTGSVTYASSPNGTTWVGTTPFSGNYIGRAVAASPSNGRFVSIWTDSTSSYGVYSV
jgi:hypothetical protein